MHVYLKYGCIFLVYGVNLVRAAFLTGLECCRVERFAITYEQWQDAAYVVILKGIK